MAALALSFRDNFHHGFLPHRNTHRHKCSTKTKHRAQTQNSCREAIAMNGSDASCEKATTTSPDFVAMSGEVIEPRAVPNCPMAKTKPILNAGATQSLK